MTNARYASRAKLTSVQVRQLRLYFLSKGNHPQPEDGRCAMESCVEWEGRRSEKGYGYDGRGRRAHRVAWERVHGPVPDGLCVLHRCDNPPCVNPEHLFLGTQADNVADRDAKGRTVPPPSRAKLTSVQVRQLRLEYERGLTTQQALAERWGVSRGNVSKILNRKAYVDA